MHYSVKTPYLVQKLFSGMVWQMPVGSEKSIYLTFDDGPAKGITDWVLDELNKFGAKASFFCIGRHALNFRDTVHRIISEGHALGNHTFDHLNGWKTSTPKYLANVEQCGEVVPSSLFRPPYGKLRIGQYFEIRKKYKVVMWDVVSGDFDRKVTKEKCLDNVLENIKPGSIVLMHDKDRTTEKLQYTLPRLLSHFSEKGYRFKPIEL